MSKDRCGYSVSWWDGEYESTCQLPEGHQGPHHFGMSCFDDDSQEVEIKTLPPRPIYHSISYHKAGQLHHTYNEVLDSQNKIIVYTPEPGVEIRIEVNQ